MTTTLIGRVEVFLARVCHRGSNTYAVGSKQIVVSRTDCLSWHAGASQQDNGQGRRQTTETAPPPSHHADLAITSVARWVLPAGVAAERGEQAQFRSR